MKPLFLIFAFLLGSFIAYYGFKWVRVFTASDYDKMLAALYKQTVPLVKIEEIKDLGSYTILDTRSSQEFKVSSIKNAHWLDYENPDWEWVNALPKEQDILVYCSVGYRSERIGEQLIKMGFVNVYNLYGGIFQWANQHHLLVDSAQQKTQKVHGYSPSWGKWLNKDIEVVY